MHHFLKYDRFRLSIWELANQPNTSTSRCKRCDPIESRYLLRILMMVGEGDEHWTTAGDVSRVSAINEPIAGWSTWACHHPVVLDRSGESRSSLSRCFCRSVGSLWRIASLLDQSVLGGVPSPLAMKALLEILLFPIDLIISLIPLWTSAAFTGFTAITTFATLLCKEQSFWSQPIFSLDCSFLFDELGDYLIGGGGHRGVFVHHELQEDIPLVVPWNSKKEVEDVLLLTHRGDCLCRVRIGSISVCGRWPSPEIVIFDSPIDPQCVVVDISAVL